MEHDAKPRRTIVAYVPDLLDRSKVAAAGGVRFVATAGQLPAAVADAARDPGAEVVVVIDLNLRNVLARRVVIAALDRLTDVVG